MSSFGLCFLISLGLIFLLCLESFWSFIFYKKFHLNLLAQNYSAFSLIYNLFCIGIMSPCLVLIPFNLFWCSSSVLLKIWQFYVSKVTFGFLTIFLFSIEFLFILLFISFLFGFLFLASWVAYLTHILLIFLNF